MIEKLVKFIVGVLIWGLLGLGAMHVTMAVASLGGQEMSRW